MTPSTSYVLLAYARYSSEQQRAASIDDQLRNCGVAPLRKVG